MAAPALVLTLPATYGWVGIGAFSSLVLTAWQTMQVGKARKLAGIKYPQLYAETHQAEKSRSAHIFNCTQRAHANTLEYQPGFLFATFVAGLKVPRIATALAFTWTLSRVYYTVGYTSGDPSKRVTGAKGSTFSQLTLYGLTIWTLFDFVARNDFKF